MDRMLAVFHLGLKELVSLARDTAMVMLIVYAFTYAVYGPAKGAPMELRDASVAIADADRSELSMRIAEALLPPRFLAPRAIARSDIDDDMDAGRHTFAIEVPAHFQRDVEAGRTPALQVSVDATAMTQAGRGAAYIEAIAAEEVSRFAAPGAEAAPDAARLVVRARFNPNLEEPRFLAIAHIIENVTMLGLILCGAAVVREREHGTLEHLLVMPLTPLEIMAAKVWPNALVIVVAVVLSLELVVRRLLHVPVQGSVALFVAGAALYMFSITSLSILLATVAGTMPRFGLLVFVVFIVLNMLSGGATPPDAMPAWLRSAMQVSPTTHFIGFSIAVLCRGAQLADVWPHVVVIVALGALFFLAAAARFRTSIAANQ